MYLSRLQLNHHSRHVWRALLANPYELHRAIMLAFPDGVRREDTNTLYRLEIDQTPPLLLVQSEVKPDWSKLNPNWLYPVSPFDPLPNPAVRAVEGLHLAKGLVLRFRLVANPTVKKVRRNEDGSRRKNGNRVPLVREEKQIEWLKRKGEQYGFRLRQVTVSEPQKYLIWKQKRLEKTNGAPPITLFT
ncbi:type I-E CRISPR-associated protein Cas6/Cse3/CasE, partial [Candidatus Parcubacteria bacterium]